MSVAERFKTLEEKYEGARAELLLNAFINEEFPGKIALVSSFGIEAALLLSMVAQANKKTPVIFLDTQKHFPETIQYRDTIIDHLGLENVKTYYPDYVDVQRDDPHDDLWDKNSNTCCYIRKVKPLNAALKPYKAWITGRKRFHGGLRSDLPVIELFEGKIKINPLATLSIEEIKAEFDNRGLPSHPLQAVGYRSVGCSPCTSLPTSDGDARSGRWSGQDKQECGIHLGADGKFHKGAA